MIQRNLSILAHAAVLTATSAHLSAHGPDHTHAPAGVQFVLNKGQWDPAALYRTDVPGATVFLERNGASWVKLEEGTDERLHDISTLSMQEQADFKVRGHAWRMRFHQPSPDLAIQAANVRSAYHNYFIGPDPSRWASRVPLFGEVMYRDVWPGVDVHYYGSDGHLKYDLLLAPGTDPGQVGLRYEGVDGLAIDTWGRLVIATSVGDVLEMAPVAFYADGAREPIGCRYRLSGGVLRYELDGHDASRPVIIDPLLIASTFSGATGASNYGHCATYDDDGNIYTGARNFGPTYPVSVGAFQTVMGGGGTDISVSKINPDGSALIWASYLGGSSGENPHSLVANSLGQLVVLGSSMSTDFPTTANAYDNSHNGGLDMTVTVIGADGTNLLGSTFVGGSDDDGYNSMWGNYGENYRGEVITDAADNILIASFSSSANFPTTGGAYQSALAGGQDAVVLGLDPNASDLQFSTYVGGANDDAGMGIRLVDGALVVCGYTTSSNFPSVSGAYQPTFQGGESDGFVVKMDPGGSTLTASTFFGTEAMDRAYFLDSDLNGDIWIYGQTEGTIPIQPAGTWGQANGTIFIAKLDASLSAAPITTVMGLGSWGGSALAPVAFLVDVCDNIYISGYNAASGMPTTPDALFTTGSFYLAAFDVDMAGILFATYYGGSHVDGGTSRFDKNGIVYQGVCSGMGSMTATPWAMAPNQFVSWDIGVFKIDFQVAGVNAAGASTLNQGCAPITIDFSNASSGDTWIWDFGDGSPPVEGFEPSHTYNEPGEYTVMLIAMDSLSCNLADTTFLPITIGQQQPITAGLEWQQVADCEQMQITAQNTSTGEPIDHIWDMGDGTTYTTDDILHTYSGAGDYEILLVAFDPTGCSDADTIVVPITIAPLEFTFDVPDEVLCRDATVLLDASAMAGTYAWSTGSTSPSITVSETGTYWVTISNPAGCIGTDTVVVEAAPEHDLGFQVTTCPDVSVPLTIPLPDALEYHWMTGTDEATYLAPGVEAAHAFWVIDAFGCPHADTAHVRLYDPEALMFAPNAFSPNGDGINDVFRIVGFGEEGAELSIYDRWGEQLYRTDAPSMGWDGVHKGRPVKNDVYVYELTYRGICDNRTQRSIGHVTVIR